MPNIHEAKTHFSKLVNQVENGSEVVISRSGVPVARLVPYRAPARVPGIWEGRIRIAADFDETPELTADFEGE